MMLRCGSEVWALYERERDSLHLDAAHMKFMRSQL